LTSVGWVLEQVPDGQVIESEGDEPEVDIAAERALWGELDGFAGGEGDGGDLGQLVANLQGGVGGADNDDALAAERARIAVVGGVQDGTGERAQPRQLRAIWLPKSPGRGDHDRGGQLGAVLDLDGESTLPPADRGHAMSGADVGVKVLGIAAEVVDDLVPMRVAVWVAGEVHSR
jgi:hypothetical protein